MKVSHEKRNRVTRAIKEGAIRVGSDYSSDYLPAGEEAPKNITRKARKRTRIRGADRSLEKREIQFETLNRDKVAVFNQVKRLSKKISDKHAFAIVSGISMENVPVVKENLKATRKTDLKFKFECLGLDEDAIEGLIVDYLERLCRCRKPFSIEWI